MRQKLGSLFNENIASPSWKINFVRGSLSRHELLCTVLEFLKTPGIDCGTKLICRSLRIEDNKMALAATNVILEKKHIAAHPQKSSSAALLASLVWRALVNMGKYHEIVRLLKLPPFSETVRNNPRFAFKFLLRDYLVRGSTAIDGVNCFLHHYTRLHDALPDHLLRQTLHWDITLHNFSDSGNQFALTMGRSRPSDKEGELSLNLKVNGDIVYVLGFTIIPGCVVGANAAEVFLVTRLQGTPGCYAQIKLATKASRDVGPSALLLAALQGVANSFGVKEIAAVNAEKQSSYCEGFAECFKGAYDDFFSRLVMDKTAKGFYCSPVPIEDKPIALIKQGHKLRTKEKRAFKQQVQACCAGLFIGKSDLKSHDPDEVTKTSVSKDLDLQALHISWPTLDKDLIS
jgi:uncharacterized protein VirK/YbjX